MFAEPMEQIIDDLLDIARVVQGKVELQRELIDCRDVIQDALCSTSPACQEHNQTVSVALPDDEIWLQADRTRLLQVFANLLTNAAKYTPDGGRISLNAETDGATRLFGSRTTEKGSHLVCFLMSSSSLHRKRPLIPADWASD